MRNVIIGACVAIAAMSVGLSIDQWQWWAFAMSLNVALFAAMDETQ